MAAGQYNTLWKPYSQGKANPGGASFLAPYQFKGVNIVDSKGTKLDSLWYGNEENGTYKWGSKKPGSYYGQNAYIQGDLGNNQYQYFKIPDAGKTWGSVIDNSLFSQAGSMEKALGLDPQVTRGGGGSNMTGPYAPNQVGPYGFAPADLTKLFPKPTNTTAAPYTYTDPMAFAQQYGQANKEQYAQNFGTSQSMALDTLQTELQGLQGFTPAAAALQRSTASADNVFNQQQRTQQVNTAMPNALSDLEAQRVRANAYASGNLPEGMNSSALAMNIAGNSVDNSTAGGFGATSSVARKESSLMSVQQQLQLGQYGESLLGQNLQTTSALALSPTEYANAASQIKVTPSLSASQLTSSYLGDLNQNTMISPTAALQTAVQQNEYRTSQLQGVNDTNASQANNFALTKFQYQVGYAGAVAGAAQTSLNTSTQLQLAQDYLSQVNSAQGAAQNAGAISSTISAIGSAIGAVGGAIGSVANAVKQPAQTGYQTPSTVDIGSTTGLTNSTLTPNNDMSGGVTGSGNDLGGLTSAGPSAGSVGSVTPEVIYSGGGSGLGGMSSGVDTGSMGSISPDMSMRSYSMPASTATTANSIERSLQIPVSRTGQEGAFNAALINGADNVLHQAGVSNSPATGLVMSGVNTMGQHVYTAPHLQNNTDTTTGGVAMATTNALLGTLPLDGISAEHVTAQLQGVGKASTDVGLMGTLDQHAANNDSKAFADTALGAFGKKNVAMAVTTPDGKMMAFDAHALAVNWNTMSPAQKSLGLAAMGVKGTTTPDGKPLLMADIKKEVLGANGQVATPRLALGQGIALMKAGVNVPPMVTKWNDLSVITKALTGKTSVEDITTVATEHNLLGRGPSGAAIKTSPEEINSAGFTVTPHLGVGAISGPAGARPPKGFVTMESNKDFTVAVPAGLEKTYSGVTPVTQSAGTPVTRQAQVSAGQVAAGTQGLAQGVQGVANATGNTGVAAGAGAASTVAGIGGFIANFNQLDTAHQISGTAGSAVAVTNLANQAGAFGNTAATTANSLGGTVASGANATGGNAAVGSGLQGAGTALSAANLAINWDNMNDTEKGINSTAVAVNAAAYAGSNVAASAVPFVNIAAGAYQVSQTWGDGGKTAAIAGGMGGAMMMAGTIALVGGPVGWVVGGAMMAAAIVGSAVHTGKAQAQNERDAYRGMLKQAGIADDKYQITLADGSTADIGLDGQGNLHQAADPSKLTDTNHSKGLNPYDVDYTSNLDYASNMSSGTLARLMAGGSNSKAVNQVGSQLGNACLGSIGFNGKLTQENFDTVMANNRAQYAKAGLTSKAAAYQVANQAYAEGRISDVDLITMHQGINMTFDDSKTAFSTAQKLFAGVPQGAQIAASSPEPTGTVANPSKGIGQTNFPSRVPGMTQPTDGSVVLQPAKGTATQQQAQDILSGYTAATGVPGAENAQSTAYARKASGQGNTFKGFDEAVNQSKMARPLAESSARSRLMLDKESARSRNMASLGAQS